MDLALRFSTRCATSYRRASDRTRKLFNAAVPDEVHVRDGHVVDAAHKEAFDLLFSSPKFKYGVGVGRVGFEPTKLARQIYSLLPLSTWVPTPEDQKIPEPN
jgi:hypothetical protein